ncbi:MAG: hypothetical protein R6X32_18285 [Chloroflexota bacterium]
MVLDTNVLVAASRSRRGASFRIMELIPDAKDDMLLDLAVAARAKIIVTFNLKHFRGSQRFGIKAITPRDFLVEIGDIQ